MQIVTIFLLLYLTFVIKYHYELLPYIASYYENIALLYDDIITDSIYGIVI